MDKLYGVIEGAYFCNKDRTQILKLLYEEEFKRAADTNRGNVSSHFVPYVGVTAGSY